MNRPSVFCTIVMLLAGGGARAGEIPVGQLPGDVIPKAYRLALDVDPSRTSFTGSTQIDATLKKATRTIFLHGLGLRVSSVKARTKTAEVTGIYREVDPSGVAQIDLPRELPAGDVTLLLDYAADFRSGAEGLFRAEVGGTWYAWTQMEPIDARRMFPCFDEPGFKTPFSVSVTAPKELKVFANAPETSAAPAGESVAHHFATTEKLPTYLVAIGVGPFDVVEAVAPANEVRPRPLRMRVIATRGQTPRMQFAAREAPRILALTEKYTRIPFPFAKLDLLATPILGGAMENAGLITFDDTLLLLDATPPFRQLRDFAEVVAHEIAHQWFGDLVTPSWWTDIWLNESFAEWLGKKIGDQWRPDLGIAALGVRDAFSGMAADSLGKGRPIRQTITENRQIASAFDDITYQKGGQVLAMFESYLGEARFAKGVHLHLKRYARGSATADDFFRSLAEAAADSKVVSAMRTFTDQTGVPLVNVNENASGLALTQSRYRPLGVAAAAPQTWIIPLCMSRAATHECRVLESASATLPPYEGGGALMPNASGAGYYRFRLGDAGWDALIAAAPTLPGREALAFADSLWADFAAGTGSFERVIAAARGLSTNPERLAVLELALRLQDLTNTVLTPEQRPPMRAIISSIYAPRLAALGFDPAAGAHAQDSSGKQALRQSLVPLVALIGRDPQVRMRLYDAAQAYLDGNSKALDPAFRLTALAVGVQLGGTPFMNRLHEALLKSTDSQFRADSSVALGAANTPELARQAVDYALSPGLQSMESIRMMFSLAGQPESRGELTSTVEKNFKRVMETFPGFARSHMIELFDGACAREDAVRLDQLIAPKLAELGGGELELAQMKERIGLCVALKEAKGAEIARRLAN
jgi:hypothetical protein